jgi:GT2 family glycosyltransferase
MAFPKASILWVNYNSMNFINIVTDSLKEIANLDYPNYEVIVVDNGSTDGSFTVIRELAERNNFKLIRLNKNLGFTGGNNAGFRARDKDSKYVVLINNDAIPFQNSLRELVELMENEEDVGGAQGIILDFNGLIDRAGMMVDEVLASYPLFRGENPKDISRPLVITYPSGAFAVYRVKAVLDVWHGKEKLFFDFGFGYLDDNVLGLQLWNHGWKCKFYPVISGKHRQGASFGKASPLRAYLSLRNSLLLGYITNSRYRKLIPIYALRDSIPRAKSEAGSCIGRAIRDFMRIKPLLKGYILDLYKAPVVRLGPRELIGLIGLRRRVTAKISRELYALLHDEQEVKGVNTWHQLS